MLFPKELTHIERQTALPRFDLRLQNSFTTITTMPCMILFENKDHYYIFVSVYVFIAFDTKQFVLNFSLRLFFVLFNGLLIKVVHKTISLVSLFNGISILFRLFNAKAILLEEQ